MILDGLGGDVAEGGVGDDTYIYTGGDDVYSEFSSGGSDQVILPSGIDSDDITYYRANNFSLFIAVGTLGSIEIPGFFNSSYHQIEMVKFYDTTTFDPTGLTSVNFYGTATAETMDGQAGVDDYIYGLAGDDQLTGLTGNDRLDGGVGNDFLSGKEGDDTYVMSAGFDTIWESAGGSADGM